MTYKIATDLDISGDLVSTNTISTNNVIVQGRTLSDFFNLESIIDDPLWGSNELFSPQWKGEELHTETWGEVELETPSSDNVYDIIGKKADISHTHDGFVSISQRDRIASWNNNAEVNTILSVCGKTEDVTLSRGDVDLNRVNNTLDIDKIISNATQLELEKKVPIYHYHSNVTDDIDGYMSKEYKLIIDNSTPLHHDVLSNIGSYTHSDIDNILTSHTSSLDNIENNITTHSHPITGSDIIDIINTTLGYSSWQTLSNEIIRSVGFVSGGSIPNTILTFLFSSNITTTTHGNLPYYMPWCAGTSSLTNGFVIGSDSNLDKVYVFNFSSIVTLTLHATLNVNRPYTSGSQSNIQSFHSGGGIGAYTTIDKFDHATTSSQSSHGNLINTRWIAAGFSSSIDGYIGSDDTYTNIERFSFSSNTVANAHGNISTLTYGPGGCSSIEKGFQVGGYIGAVISKIDVFDFSSNVTSTTHSNLSVARYSCTGISSNTQGYVAGGNTNPSDLNTIDTFYYASITNAVDHGDLLTSKSTVGGHEV
jgi:hypothetical protein